MRQTDPPMTANQQLLISTAVDRCVEQLKLNLPPDSRVFLDSQFVDVEPAHVIFPKYTMAAVRNRLLQLGALLVADRAEADVIVEMRSGAQSVNDRRSIIGLPGITVPIPLSGPLAIPEIPIFRYHKETGWSKLALAAYRRDGVLLSETGVQHGHSKRVNWVFFFIFSYAYQDIHPE